MTDLLPWWAWALIGASLGVIFGFLLAAVMVMSSRFSRLEEEAETIRQQAHEAHRRMNEKREGAR